MGRAIGVGVFCEGMVVILAKEDRDRIKRLLNLKNYRQRGLRIERFLSDARMC
jgi:hypothetical protein